MDTHGPSTNATGELHRVQGDAAFDTTTTVGRLDDLYVRYASAMRGYARSLTRSSEDADDVVHDVFLALAQDRGAVANRHNVAGFLMRAVHNRAINLGRANRIRDRELERCFRQEKSIGRCSMNDGEAQVLSDEIGEWVECLISQLAPKQREAFTLARLYGVPYAEVARLLGIAPSTVATHVIRASRTIAQRLDG